MRRVLLDEQLPRGLLRELEGFDVSTVPEMGWSGLKSGPLFQQASSSFDVFVTGDKNIPFQQNLAKWSFGFVLLDAPSTRIEDLLPLIPALRNALPLVRPGELVRIEGP